MQEDNKAQEKKTSPLIEATVDLGIAAQGTFGIETENKEEKRFRNCQNQHSLLPNRQDSLTHRPKRHGKYCVM